MAVVGGWVRGLGSEASIDSVFSVSVQEGIPMPPLRGNFAQQAINNQRGARDLPNNNNLNSPSMYYDYSN